MFFRKNFIRLFFCTGKNIKKERMKQEMISAKTPLIVAGDGRHDSMGHSAKYCAYTTFCCTIPKIIHFSLVQVQLSLI